jgi:hypothetical protein
MPAWDTLIAAFVLLPLGLVLVLSILGLLLHPLALPALRAIEGVRFSRRLARAARADSFLKFRRLDAGLRELEQAFCLFTVRADHRLIEQISAHHTGLLSRFLTVIEDLPQGRVRLLSLAKVDRLLDRRREMQRALLQLRGRSARDGRRLQLERELGRNAATVRIAVRELLADLELHRNRRASLH